MDTQAHNTEPRPPTDPGSTDERPTRRSRRVLWTRVGIGLAAVVLGAVLLDLGTASPVLCGSCHGMAERAHSWRKSTHAEVACVSCHQAPTAWYELPQRLAARARLLSRDVRWQLAGRSGVSTPTSPAAAAEGAALLVSSENCLQCHDPNRKATSGFRILIDHAEHAKRNKTCLSCHINTAHPEPTRGTPLSLMDQCFQCHGTAKYPEASDECSVCHPGGYELKPASHDPADWKKTGHGRLANKDRAQCDLCHKPSFCTDCHGLEMPHPAGWAKGDPATHATFAQKNRQVCGRCHLEKPDLCSMCHHRGWDPGKGPWTTQHPLMVGERGADFCLRCHTRAYCSYCHVSASLGMPLPSSESTPQ